MWAYDIDCARLRRAAGRHRGPSYASRPVTGPSAPVAGDRDLVRRDGGGRGRGRPRGALLGRLQPGRPARALRRRRARAGRPGPHRALTPVVGRGPGRARRASAAGAAPPVDAVAATCGPGLVGLAAGGAVGGQGAWPWPGASPSSGSTTSRPTSSPPSREPGPRAGRWWCCWSRAATPCSSQIDRPGPLPAARPDHRRRRRRGLRQGGPLPRASATPGGPAIDRLADRGRPRPPSPSPRALPTTGSTSPSRG